MRKSSALLRGAAAVGLVALVAGCAGVSTAPPVSRRGAAAAGAVRHPGGLLPGLRYRDGGTATMTSSPPPASAALPGANDVVAAGGAVLLAATDSGIWRSTDSGATWRRVLSGIETWSLTAVTGGGYAALGVVPGPNTPALTPGGSLPELATSADGVSWQVTKLAEPSGSWPFGYGYRFVLNGTGADATGVAVPDPGAWSTGSQPAYRTTDGGRHWTRLPLTAPRAGGPAGVSGGVAMLPDGRTVFVTAAGPGNGCAGAVYESRDGGATWALLSASCQPYPLADVQFTSNLDGFAAGGLTPKFGGGQVVEATTDGGATWHVLFHAQSAPASGAAATGFLRLDMLGASQGGGELGWAVSGGCTAGQNGPCPGAVYVTDDGGVRWQLTGQAAIAVAGLDGDRAVAVRAGIAATTADGGRTWAEQSRPETVGTLAFAGLGRYQFWSTSIGTDVSADGGIRWSPVPAFPATLAAHLADLIWQAAPSALLGYDGGDGQAWASGDGGRTWTTSTVPGSGGASQPLAVALGTGGAAYAVAGPGADCLSQQQLKKVERVKPGWTPPSGASVLYSGSDAGARWSTAGLTLPFGVQVMAAMAASGTRIAIIDACGRLELSTDAGAHWSGQSLGSAPVCTVSLLGTEAWLRCLAGDGTWSLHSADGGATWLRYRLPAPADQAPGIFATGPDSAVMPIGGALWRTSDGGRSWTQSWPLAR